MYESNRVTCKLNVPSGFMTESPDDVVRCDCACGCDVHGRVLPQHRNVHSKVRRVEQCLTDADVLRTEDEANPVIRGNGQFGQIDAR